MSTLCKTEINRRLNKMIDDPYGLFTGPLLDANKQVGESSIDLRLGFEFIVFKKSSFSEINFSDDSYKKQHHKWFNRVKLDVYEDLVLHPNQLVLGSTFEYIKLPIDVNGSVISKSSWGRMGLIIATATNVDPGYRGCLTLELVNMGEVPLKLRPGLPIAQLILNTLNTDNTHKLKKFCVQQKRRLFTKFHYSIKNRSINDMQSDYHGYQGSYSAAVGPEFPKFKTEDIDWKYFYDIKHKYPLIVDTFAEE